MSVGATATPLAFVMTVVAGDPAKLAPAPVLGAVNVTGTLLRRSLFESLTVACRPIENAVPTTALCGDPAVAVIALGAPTALVRLKLAGVVIPVAVAVTA